MEIKVGEYVRTKNGKIDKVINNNYYISEYLECEKGIVDKENILKHSFNIIDLIEVNDLVNGHRVANIKNDEGRVEIGLENDYMINYYIEEQDIKTILTHEQYEINCYKIN